MKEDFAYAWAEIADHIRAKFVEKFSEKDWYDYLEELERVDPDHTGLDAYKIAVTKLAKP